MRLKPTLSHSARLWANSSSVSPGKPAMMSHEMEAAGSLARIMATVASYCSAV